MTPRLFALFAQVSEITEGGGAGYSGFDTRAGAYVWYGLYEQRIALSSRQASRHFAVCRCATSATRVGIGQEFRNIQGV